jgi:hypothetical protein
LVERHSIALADVGRREAAIAAFERILGVDPANATARDWLKQLGVNVEAKPSPEPSDRSP